MSAAAPPGEGVGASAYVTRRAILRRVVLGSVVLGGLLLAPGLRATALYRCTGGGGELVFSSSTVGYHACRRLGSFSGTRTKRPSASARVSFIAVSGSVDTSARALATPSLAQVTASVETTGRPWMPMAQAARFVAVVGSAETSARLVRLVSSAGLDGRSGQWTYHESRNAPDPGLAMAATGAAGDKVLRGAVYRVVHRDGSVEYTNVPQPSQIGHAVTLLFSYISTCMACNLHSPINWNSTRLNIEAYAAAIHAASIEFGVEEAFLRAVIHAESAFNPRAMSLKGAQGLMQLMPTTASDMGVLDAFDADQNIRGGARYLSLLLRSFAGNERLAAAAYNAGPGAVQHYNGVPPYAETQVYVERVGTLRKRYGDAAHPPLASARGSAAKTAIDF